MGSTAVQLPTGAALEQEIDAIEAHDYDAAISKVIVERVKIADARLTPLQHHGAAFTASRARLMARLAGDADA